MEDCLPYMRAVVVVINLPNFTETVKMIVEGNSSVHYYCTHPAIHSSSGGQVLILLHAMHVMSRIGSVCGASLSLSLSACLSNVGTVAILDMPPC